jgi:hypothetical protein
MRWWWRRARAQAALQASLMELELTKNQGMFELAELEAAIAASLALESERIRLVREQLADMQELTRAYTAALADRAATVEGDALRDGAAAASSSAPVVEGKETDGDDVGRGEVGCRPSRVGRVLCEGAYALTPSGAGTRIVSAAQGG